MPRPRRREPIEGWTETTTHESWDLTANLLPWSLFQVFIVDDPTYGVVDESPIGY